MIDEVKLPVSYPGGSYEVIVGAGLLARVRELANVPAAMALITDENVGPLHGESVEETAVSHLIPAGEQHKTLATVADMYDALLAGGIDRKGSVVALGGGVVGDMAGFAAASFMRGIHFVQCPTTLLAMVDASVGGKTGVDLPQGKNLVGAFKQPLAVLADLETLRTLPPVEFSAGMAEVIKHGLITDVGLFEWLETATFTPNSPLDALQSLVVRAIKVKQQVVQEDPFENGRRATLNLGHTFGHAIEQVSGYAVRHGEGVAMGLVVAANLSAKLGLCSGKLQPRIEKALKLAGLPITIPAQYEAEPIYAAMFSDKKKAAGKLRFILIRNVGDVFVMDDVPKTAVIQAINNCKL